MSIRPGPQPRHEGISAQEREAFRALLQDGAWTTHEANQALGRQRARELASEGYLGLTFTAMGYLYFLQAPGRVAATGTCDKPRSFGSCINLAYRRLALQRLGWEAITDLQHLPRPARDDLTPVQTPEGIVWLTAQYGVGRGCSVQKLQKLVADWRSEALYHNIRVVVVTPNLRRGQRLQEREESWLRLVPCLPFKQQEGRLMYPDSHDPQACDGPVPLPETADLPELSQHILSLSREARIQQARQALEVDSVLSRQQLQRHYGLDTGDLQGVPFVHALLHPCHGRYGLEVGTRFFLASARMRHMKDPYLAHHAGLAEMRQQLGVMPDKKIWQLEPRSRLSYEQPDALWHSPYGTVAIEYDTGSYSSLTIQKKREAFRDRGFSATVWGVPSVKRQQRLTQAFGQEVLLAKWFDNGKS